jgi:SAM-dependent methyltransferase
VIWLLVLFLITLAFAIAGPMGAPYVPILKRQSDAFFVLADMSPGQTLVDLGSGDGRLLRAAATRNIHGIGYEINPIMVLVSRIVCWRYRRQVKLHLANLWQVTLPNADVIYVFLMPKHMEKLRELLDRQINRPTKVITYAFEIPGLIPIAHNTNTFVYQFPTGTNTSHPSNL